MTIPNVRTEIQVDSEFLEPYEDNEEKRKELIFILIDDNFGELSNVEYARYNAIREAHGLEPVAHSNDVDRYATSEDDIEEVLEEETIDAEEIVAEIEEQEEEEEIIILGHNFEEDPDPEPLREVDELLEQIEQFRQERREILIDNEDEFAEMSALEQLRYNANRQANGLEPLEDGDNLEDFKEEHRVHEFGQVEEGFGETHVPEPEEKPFLDRLIATILFIAVIPILIVAAAYLYIQRKYTNGEMNK